MGKEIRFIGLFNGFFLVGVILLLSLGLVFIINNRIPRITDVDYESAVARWSEKAPQNYAMDVQIGGRQPGLISTTIQHGKVVQLSRNGTPVTQMRTWEFWTVPVLLESIGEDLDLQKNPQRKADKFKIGPEADMSLRGTFDPEFGYPTRYHRSIANANQDIEWTIIRFEKLSATAAPVGEKDAAPSDAAN